MDGLETFARLDGGHFLDDLAADLYEVAGKVIEKAAKTGRPEKGAVTVKFQVVKAPGGEPTVMFIPNADKKFPTREPAGNIFYALEGQFHTRDPRQASLDVRVVDVSTGEIREAPAEKPAVRETEQS